MEHSGHLRHTQTHGFQLISVGKDLTGCALEGNFSVVDHHQAVHRPGHLLHGVGHQDDGGILGLVVVPDVAQNGLHAHRVQSGGGLVQNEHLGLHGDDACDGHPALLAAGELKGGLVQLVVPQANKVGRGAHPPVDLLLVKSHVGGTKGDVFIYRLFKQLVLRILEHQTHLEPGHTGALGIGPDVLPLKEHLAGGGFQQAVEVLNKGGFPRAGVADDAQVLPLIGGKVHIQQGGALEGSARRVGVGEMFCFDDRFHCGTILMAEWCMSRWDHARKRKRGTYGSSECLSSFSNWVWR